MFMGFKSGDTEIFLWEEQERELYKMNGEKMDEHEDELKCIDILTDK